jgi:hypothetical protein
MRRFLPFLALFFGSLCFGQLFIVIFANATEMDCARQPDQTYTCEFRTLLLGQYPTFTRSVDGIVDIVLADSPSSEGGGRVYRAEFVRADGRQVPLTEVWIDNRGAVAQQVEALGTQIHAGAPQIAYRVEAQAWLLYLIPGLTVMAMLLSFLMLRPGSQPSAHRQRTPHRMG